MAKHLEQKPGEVFITNLHQKTFNKIKLQTKRLGLQAYSGNFKKLSVEDWRPMFVKASEIKNINITVAKLRKIITD